MGYEVKAKSEPTAGEIIFLGAMGGAIGGLVAESSQQENRLSCDAKINDMIYKKLESQLKEKGYNVELICSKFNKWDLFKLTDDTSKNTYAKFVKKYEVGAIKDSMDAILFIEYILEARYEKKQKIEELPPENMHPGFTYSQIWVYDTKTHQNLYYGIISRGGDSFGKVHVPEAAEKLSVLKDLPAITETQSSKNERGNGYIR